MKLQQIGDEMKNIGNKLKDNKKSVWSIILVLLFFISIYSSEYWALFILVLLIGLYYFYPKSLYKIGKWVGIILIILIFIGYFFGYKPIREYYNEVTLLEEKMGDLVDEFNFAKGTMNYDKSYDIYLDYVDTLSEYSFKMKNQPIILLFLYEKEINDLGINLINQRIEIQNQMRETLVSLRVLDVIS